MGGIKWSLAFSIKSNHVLQFVHVVTQSASRFSLAQENSSRKENTSLQEVCVCVCSCWDYFKLSVSFFTPLSLFSIQFPWQLHPWWRSIPQTSWAGSSSSWIQLLVCTRNCFYLITQTATCFHCWSFSKSSISFYIDLRWFLWKSTWGLESCSRKIVHQSKCNHLQFTAKVIFVWLSFNQQRRENSWEKPSSICTPGSLES